MDMDRMTKPESIDDKPILNRSYRWVIAFSLMEITTAVDSECGAF